MLCNPYLPPDEYVPDGEPYVFGDRVYVYGSHDEADNHGFCVGDYVVWSAPCDDLGAWRYEGVSYSRMADPHNKDGAHALFAPDLVKGNDGRYYLYYCLDFLQEFGVAVSDYPQGPFAFYGHVKKPDGSLLQEYFPYDPSVLLDDDSRVYLYYGFAAHFSNGSFGVIVPSPGCMVVELESDMLTVKSKPQMCLPSDYDCEGTSFPPEHSYFEAPSIRKIGKKYYLVYSSQSQHELCYAVSDYPDKDFKYGGVIISNGDIGYEGNQKPINYIGTNHGGLVHILGNWYIFYHRNTHGIATSRQGCAEKVSFDQNGNIAQVPVTSYGMNNQPFVGEGEFPAYIACYLERSNTSVRLAFGADYKATEPYFYEEKTVAGYEHYIANIVNHTIWGYKAFQLKRHMSIQIIVRGDAEGVISVSGSRTCDNLLGEAMVHLNGSQWQTLDIPLENPEGIYSLYFRFEGEGSLQFKKLRFEYDLCHAYEPNSKMAINGMIEGV